MTKTAARRRGATPSTGAVQALTAPRSALRKAPDRDPVTGAGAPGRTKTSKVGFWQQPESTARMRAAFMATRHLTGDRSLTEFIDRAVMAKVAELEAQHHGGEPWAAVGTGVVPTGRPLEG